MQVSRRHYETTAAQVEEEDMLVFPALLVPRLVGEGGVRVTSRIELAGHQTPYARRIKRCFTYANDSIWYALSKLLLITKSFD
jgi:hypothetical protein